LFWLKAEKKKTAGQPRSLSVVNWGGEEQARLLVLESDTVMFGMQQIEEQLGVPPRCQRLVVGEEQLAEGEIWLQYGVSDWSTVQLTVIVEVSAAEYINHT